MDSTARDLEDAGFIDENKEAGKDESLAMSVPPVSPRNPEFPSFDMSDDISIISRGEASMANNVIRYDFA